MSDTSVKLQFFGNAAAAEKEIVRLEKKFDDLKNKMEQVAKRSKKSAEEQTSSLQAAGTELARTIAGYGSLTSILGGVISSQQRLRSEAEATSVEYDKMFRKFRVQSGLTEVQGKDAQAKIESLATKNAVSPQFANAAATQMVSSGFKVGDASGSALDTLLKGLAASNRTDEDPTQLTQALGQFLSSQGLEMNDANLKKVLVASQRLFKATDFQVSDLSQLAGKASGMVGKLSVEEVMGTFDVLRNVKNADAASTAQKIIVERLSGATGDKQRETDLKSLGLKPTDVDFVGENIGTVLQRLDVGFQKVPKEKQAAIMQRLFGAEASAPAEYLIRERKRLPLAIAAAADTQGFDSDVAIATSGKAAAVQRQQNARQNLLASKGGRTSMLARELEAMQIESGVSPGIAARNREQFESGVLPGLVRGLFGERAAAFAQFGATSEYGEANKRIDDLLGSSQQQNKLLERIEANTRGKVNPNAQGE